MLYSDRGRRLLCHIGQDEQRILFRLGLSICVALEVAGEPVLAEHQRRGVQEHVVLLVGAVAWVVVFPWLGSDGGPVAEAEEHLVDAGPGAEASLVACEGDDGFPVLLVEDADGRVAQEGPVLHGFLELDDVELLDGVHEVREGADVPDHGDSEVGFDANLPGVRSDPLFCDSGVCDGLRDAVEVGVGVGEGALAGREEQLLPRDEAVGCGERFEEGAGVWEGSGQRGRGQRGRGQCKCGQRGRGRGQRGRGQRGRGQCKCGQRGRERGRGQRGRGQAVLERVVVQLRIENILRAQHFVHEDGSHAICSVVVVFGWG